MQIVMALLDGLAAIHDKKIVHRDVRAPIKSNNRQRPQPHQPHQLPTWWSMRPLPLAQMRKRTLHDSRPHGNLGKRASPLQQRHSHIRVIVCQQRLDGFFVCPGVICRG